MMGYLSGKQKQETLFSVSNKREINSLEVALQISKWKDVEYDVSIICLV